MKAINFKTLLLNKEAWFQCVIWVLFFLSINVYWTESWVSKSFLPESVAPHIALAIPFIFLLNTFWLIPTFLNKKRWHYYLILSFTLLSAFEIIRAILFALFFPQVDSFISAFKSELFSDNSLIFGVLNVLIFHVVFYSFIYRFTRDWIVNQSIIERLRSEIRTNVINLYDNNTLSLVAENVGISNDLNVSYSNRVPKIYRTTLTVKKRDGIFVLKIDNISYFQAQGDFVLAIDKDGKKHIVNDTLTNIENQLNPNHFFRINRSEILNFYSVIKYKQHIKNRLSITLRQPEIILYTSNNRTPNFRNWIDGY